MKRLVALVAAALLGGALTGTAYAAPLPIPRAGAIQVLPQPGTDLTSLPLGDAKVTTTGPGKVGWTWACTPGNPNAPGAIHDGPWIDGDEWNLLEKLAVRGEITEAEAGQGGQQARQGDGRGAGQDQRESPRAAKGQP